MHVMVACMCGALWLREDVLAEEVGLFHTQ